MGFSVDNIYTQSTCSKTDGFSAISAPKIGIIVWKSQLMLMYFVKMWLFLTDIVALENIRRQYENLACVSVIWMYISLWILISIWMSGRPSVLMMSSIWYNNNFSLQHIFKPFSTALFFGYHAYIDLHGMLNFLGCVILLDIYVDIWSNIRHASISTSFPTTMFFMNNT